MSRLHARLRRLEVEAQPANSTCAICGHCPNVVPRLRLADDDEEDGPDACSSCGRQLVFRLTFDPND